MKCFDTIHKIKPVTCAGLLSVCTVHFGMDSNVLYGEAVLFCYSFFLFHFVLFREHPALICHDPIFYGEIVLWPISCVAKMLTAKPPIINYSASPVPSCP